MGAGTAEGQIAGGTVSDTDIHKKLVSDWPWPKTIRHLPRGQAFDATFPLFYECPLNDPGYLEIFCYTDRLTYAPGDEAVFHMSTTAKSASLEVYRDAARPSTVHRAEALPCIDSPLRPGFHEEGCDWPEVHRWRIPDDIPSGFYVVVSRGLDNDGQLREQEHGFVVRAAEPGQRADIVLVSSTCTWNAYNDWGGANHYQADVAPAGFHFAPKLTFQRPFARGFVWLPEGAPRKVNRALPPFSPARYPPLEFAYARGFSKWYASAGWAYYERPFAIWAEQEGIAFDMISQLDLETDPEILQRYKCAVFLGHDEYWTSGMRDAVDRFVDQGGNVARFAGNFYWQIRLEDAARRQVCYKAMAHDHDPIRDIDQRFLTGNWEDPAIGRPGAWTFGLNGTGGMYAGLGNMVPRGPGGFTVYRPGHWSLAGTDLFYGDILGGEAQIFGYEVDGLDYEVRRGLPYPTFTDGAPETTEIIGLGLAVNAEKTRGLKSEFAFYGNQSAAMALGRYGSVAPPDVADAERGCGLIVEFTRGAGRVFNAGTCEWTAGLKLRDHAVSVVTRNVLDRYTGRR